MRNIIKFLLCISIFFIAKSNVIAEQNYIYLGDVIPDIKLYLKTDKVEKYKNMYEIINRDTNELVYCIEPGVSLKDGYFKAYQGVELIDYDLGITNDDWNYLRTIAYFGYGYQERNDIKWYAATQFIIWEYLLEGKGEIYFVDEFNNKTNSLNMEIETIKDDVNRYFLLPSFLDGTVKNVKYNESITLIDEYNVLKDCNIYNNNLDYKIDGNKITINFNLAGNNEINFVKSINESSIPKIFYSPTNQTVINKAIIKTPSKQLKFYIANPSFTLIKTTDGDYNLPLEGAKYGIYYEDGTLYQEITTDNTGKAILEQIALGKYYVKEIIPPYGYELNNEKIYFEVKDDVILKTVDKPITKDITIEKYLENKDGSISLESNATFMLYDEHNNLKETFTTDIYGKYTLSLTYGLYTLKQITTHPNYTLTNDITLDINKNTENRIIIKNKQKTGSLNVLKKDKITNELIKDEMSFKIFDITNNKYYNNGEIFKTLDGSIIINDIPYGNYYIEEIKAPSGYYLTDEQLKFKINNEEIIELNLYNDPIKGSIKIEKLAEDNLKPIENVIFGLYDSNKKLINEYKTNSNGEVLIENLLEGIYYLKELSTPKEYHILEGYTKIEVKNNVLNELKITNRLKIEIPKTGTNELLLSLIFSSFCLIIGLIICNYDKN